MMLAIPGSERRREEKEHRGATHGPHVAEH
jgi:hypothetical protein